MHSQYLITGNFMANECLMEYVLLYWGIVRNTDFNNPANVICSLSFDRDEDYFAAAGISKKIKIFEFNALFNDSIDIHYPVVEMSNRSRLSCVCWNNYIQNYLASTDYDGAVKVCLYGLHIRLNTIYTVAYIIGIHSLLYSSVIFLHMQF